MHRALTWSPRKSDSAYSIVVTQDRGGWHHWVMSPDRKLAAASAKPYASELAALQAAKRAAKSHATPASDPKAKTKRSRRLSSMLNRM